MLSLLKVALPEIDTAGKVQMGTPYMTVWTDWERDVVYKGPTEQECQEVCSEVGQILHDA